MQEQSEYVISMKTDKEELDELGRLRDQGYLITCTLEDDLLPGGLHLAPGSRVIDLGCGAGEYPLAVGQKYPDFEVIGVDIMDRAIEYANDQARAQKRTNVRFRVGNILRPLEFADHSCDFVNLRFLFGAVPRDYWTTLLDECRRILKPGGMIRMIESTSIITEEAPFNHQLAGPLMRALYHAKKTFSEYEIAVVPAILRFFREGKSAGKYESSSYQVYLLDCSAGTRFHGKIKSDLTQMWVGLRPLMLKHGDITEDALTAIIKGATAELEQPDYSATWEIAALMVKVK